MERAHLTIFGDVQAVGFRFTAIEIARDLVLTGWVRNNLDGRVEIVAEGQSRSWKASRFFWQCLTRVTTLVFN